MSVDAQVVELATHTGRLFMHKADLDQLTDAEIVQLVLGIDTGADPDPLIDLPMITLLAGVSKGTPEQWRVRTRLALAGGPAVRHPFPDPPPGVASRFPDKPMWHALSQIVPYLKRTKRWPPGRAGRPARRAIRPLAQLDPAA